LAAVGTGLARPGSASAAAGISAFFLNMNIAISLLRDANIIAARRSRTRRHHHIPEAALRRAITKARGARTHHLPARKAVSPPPSWPYAGPAKTTGTSRCPTISFGRNYASYHHD
jgi:hypothetical protein